MRSKYSFPGTRNYIRSLVTSWNIPKWEQSFCEWRISLRFCEFMFMGDSGIIFGLFHHHRSEISSFGPNIMYEYSKVSRECFMHLCLSERIFHYGRFLRNYLNHTLPFHVTNHIFITLYCSRLVSKRKRQRKEKECGCRLLENDHS